MYMFICMYIIIPPEVATTVCAHVIDNDAVITILLKNSNRHSVKEGRYFFDRSQDI